MSSSTRIQQMAQLPFFFRPGMGCHDAIRTLHQHLYKYKIQTIIDVDLANYFGTINHKILENVLREKIEDEKFI
jgi:RNA-directed DNA polymerase